MLEFKVYKADRKDRPLFMCVVRRNKRKRSGCVLSALWQRHVKQGQRQRRSDTCITGLWHARVTTLVTLCSSVFLSVKVCEGVTVKEKETLLLPADAVWGNKDCVGSRSWAGPFGSMLLWLQRFLQVRCSKGMEEKKQECVGRVTALKGREGATGSNEVKTQVEHLSKKTA